MGGNIVLSKKLFLAALFSCFAIPACVLAQDDTHQKTVPMQRVYIEKPASADSQAVTAAIEKRCPSLLAVVNNLAVADYSLRISADRSIVYRRSGEIAHITTAKFDAVGLAKDICAFAKEKAPVQMDVPLELQ